jgi:hypothetical protein
VRCRHNCNKTKEHVFLKIMEPTQFSGSLSNISERSRPEQLPFTILHAATRCSIQPASKKTSASRTRKHNASGEQRRGTCWGSSLSTQSDAARSREEIQRNGSSSIFYLNVEFAVGGLNKNEG